VRHWKFLLPHSYLLAVMEKKPGLESLFENHSGGSGHLFKNDSCSRGVNWSFSEGNFEKIQKPKQIEERGEKKNRRDEKEFSWK
jgi:hypothetical protein